MEEIACVLVAVLLVGFGIAALVLLAHRAKKDPELSRCGKCGGYVRRIQVCEVCGAVPAISLTSDEERSIAAKQLSQLYQNGALDTVTFGRVMEALGKHAVAVAVPPPLPRTLSYAAAPHADESQQVVPPPPPSEPLRLEMVTPQPQEAIPVEPETPPAEPEPRRPWSEVLASFLQESNIRWGELVGGLLMIGCSIALVATFWNEIAARPGLRFFIFTGVIAAVFGAGLYTEHRWKLPTTSRGVLLAGVLLVPLNFLVIVFQSGQPGHAMAIGLELVALGLFAWLMWLAGRVLVRQWAIVLSIGMIGTSAAQLIINRFVTGSHASDLMILALAALPAAFYLASMARALATARRWNDIDLIQSNGMMLLLGTLTFAVAVPLALLAFKAGHFAASLRAMTPVLSISIVPGLSAGLLLWRRIERQELTHAKTAWTAIAVFAALLLVGTIMLAWPHPAMILSVAIIDYVALSAIAWLCGIPAAHALALPCLVIAYIVGFHMAQASAHPDHVAWPITSDRLWTAIFSATTGPALVAIVAALGAATAWLRRAGRTADALSYGIGTAAVAVLSIWLTSVHGLGLPNDHGATWVFAIYAVAAGTLACRMQKPAIAAVACVLTGEAIVQGLVYRYPLPVQLLDRWAIALLIDASVTTLAAIASRVFAPDRKDLGQVAGWFAMGASAAAGCLVLVATIAPAAFVPWHALALRSLWVAAVWIAIAAATNRPVIMSAAHLAMCLAAVFGATALVQRQPWFAALHWPLLDVRVLQAQATGVAIVSLAWVAVRLFARRWPRGLLSTLMDSPAATLDRVVPHLVLLAGFIGIVLVAGLSGAAELSPAGNLTATAIVHPHVFASGAWLLWGVLAIVFAVRMWDRFDGWLAQALMLLAISACVLAAGHFEPQLAVASAYRWFAGGLLIVLSAAFWTRHQLIPAMARLAWPGFDSRPPNLDPQLRGMLLFATIGPILVLTIIRAGQAISKISVSGPGIGSLWDRLGSYNYLVPLILIVCVLVGYAVRERSNAFAFSAGLVLHLAVSLGYALWLVTHDLPLAETQLIRLAQLNAIAGAIYTLAWLSLRQAMLPLADQLSRIPPLLIAQAAIALAAVLAIFVPAEATLAIRPEMAWHASAEAAAPLGWVAWGLVGAALLIMIWQRRRQIPLGAFCATIIVVGSLSSLLAFRQDRADAWIAHHVLITSRALGALLMLGLGWAATLAAGATQPASSAIASRLGWKDIRRPTAQWAVVLWLMLLVLVGRELIDGPIQAWWIAGLVAASIIAVGLSLWTGANAWLYAAGLLLNVGATRWYATWPVGNLFECVQLNIAVITLGGLAALFIDLYLLRRDVVKISRIAPFHRFAAAVSVVLLVPLLLFVLGVQFLRFHAHLDAAYTLASMASLALLAIACLWDSEDRHALRRLYFVGLLCLAAGLQALQYRGSAMAWRGCVALGAYSLALGYLYMVRRSLAAAAQRLGVPMIERWPAGVPRWLSGTIIAQSAVVALAAVALVLDLKLLSARLAISIAVFAAALGAALVSYERQRRLLKHTALLAAAVGAVVWGLAWVDPASRQLELHRLVIVMSALAAVTIVYAVGLAKLLPLDEEWLSVARTLVPIVGSATGLALVAALTAEFSLAGADGVPMSFIASVVVASALLALIVGAIICAAVPGRDPLNLPDRPRTAYVYLAELLLVVFFVHVRLCWPMLFRLHIWHNYWPMIVLLLAFGGAGLGQLFRRQRRIVLAEPLENTAAFLPIVPVVSFWMLGHQYPTTINFTIVLSVAGTLYALMAGLRRSFWLGLMSALSGNGALWYLLHQADGLGFFQHPQLWLIPAALSVLAAAYLNRSRLSADQMRTVRYITLLIVYASSSADIWINGIVNAPWLPLVLAILAIAGVIAGIALRVQSFLFLGATFLLVAIATMIQYAAVQVHGGWPWWIAGIVIGTVIFIVFALFEKKRAQMLAIVEGLKEWQG